MKIGSKVYYCARIGIENDVEIFAKPVEYTLRPNYLTIQPAGGYMDLLQFGEFTNITYNGMAVPYDQWINVLNEGDRFYLNRKPAGFDSKKEPEDGWGFDADTKVVAVKGQNRSVRFTLQSIVE